MKLANNLDFEKLEFRNARIQNLASAPSSPVVGQIYFDTTGGAFTPRVWDGTSWVALFASQIANGTIPLAKLAVDPLARANHTGTQLASTVSDFNTAVRTNRLDQMTAPTADVSLSGFKLTSLAAAIADSDAVNFGQAKGLLFGSLTPKNARVMPTTNITISNPGTAVFDGITCVATERIFLGASQTLGSERGVYVFNGSGVAMTRVADMDASSEVNPGLRIFVAEGTANADKTFELTTDSPIVIGTTALTFRDVTGQTLTAGNGITISTNQIIVNPAASGGISVAAGGVSVDTTVSRRFAANVGNGSLTTVPISHNLGTRDVKVEVYRNSTPWDTVIVDMERPDGNTVNLIFAVAPTTDQYRVTVNS